MVIDNEKKIQEKAEELVKKINQQNKENREE